MSCIDAACYRRKYAIVFLLMKKGITSKKIRERHQYFIDKYPKDNIRLIDEKIEAIMDFFDSTVSKAENFVLVRNMQKKDIAPRTTSKSDLTAYPSLLKNMVSKQFEAILKDHVFA